MMISLVNLVLAPLAILVLVPLLVHLFARSRPPRFAFSSLEFLQQVMRQTLRVRRPRDWIVLLLRTLLVACLIALFLRPIFRSTASGSLFERRNVVVIIDRSASMAALSEGRSRFAMACAEASELLADLSRRDAANVIWMDASPDAAFPELGPNVPYLLGAVRSASVSVEAADIEQALQMAISMLREAEGTREIDVVSDFQATAWKQARVPNLEGISVVAVPASGDRAANTALTDLTLMPAEPLPGESVLLSCSVWNFSDNPVRPSLFLSAGEMRQSRDLFISPWSHTTAQFETIFPEAGRIPILTECTEDEFAPDNTRFAVARVRPHLRAGLVGPRTPTSAVWERALQALGLFRIETHATLATLDGPLDALLLTAWNGEHPERLRHAALQGAVVLCAPAPGSTASILESLLPDAAQETPLPVAGPLKPQVMSTPLRLRISAPEDSLFTLFSQGAYGDPARGSFNAMMPLPPIPGEATTLLSYERDIPALVRMGRVPLYLWNLNLDPAQTDWPQYAAFLPLFGELFLGERSRTSGNHDHPPGVPISLDVLPGSDITLTCLTDEESASSLLPLLSGASPRFLPEAPGLFQWQNQETEQGDLLAVNLPPVESDLRPLPEQEIQEILSSTVVSGRQARDLREGVEWWPWLLALTLGWALLEGLALWYWEGRR